MKFYKIIKYYLLSTIGILFYKIKRYSTAQFFLSLALRGIDDASIKRSYFFFKLGMCFYKRKDWGKALFYFNIAKNKNGFNKKWDIQVNMANNHLSNNHQKISTSSLVDYNAIPLEAFKRKINSFDGNLGFGSKIILDYIKKNNVEDYDLYFVCFRYNFLLENYNMAIEYLHKSLNLKSNKFICFYWLGLCYKKMNKLTEAKKCYDKYLSSIKDKKIVFFGIGLEHGNNGFWSEAVEEYRNSIRTFIASNKNLRKHYLLSQLYSRLGLALNRCYLFSDSAEAYIKSIQLSRYPSASLFFKCGECYEKNKSYRLAGKYYKEAILRSSDYQPYWYYRAAYCLERSGDIQQAQFYYQESRQNTVAYGVNPSTVLKTNLQKRISKYTQYYEQLTVKQNFVLVESFFGKSISCNPLALLKTMLSSDEFLNFRFVIVLNNISDLPTSIDDDRIICIKRQSDSYLRYLASVKYLINNVTFPDYFIRKEGQYYLNTWHGTPMKTLGRDIKSPLLDYANVARNLLQATHIVSQNDFTNEILLSKYCVKDFLTAKVATTGYPRTDSFRNLTLKRKNNILASLSIRDGKPVVLYAPTWRGTSELENSDIKRLHSDLKKLESENYHLIFKPHNLLGSKLQEIYPDVQVVPPNIDVTELLGCIDGLISDYSSISYDFLSTKKPLFSYIYDFESYQSERGLYVSKEEIPGIICDSIEELKHNIEDNLGKVMDYDGLNDKYVPLDDGSVSRRVLNFFFFNDNTHLYDFHQKPTHLIFSGPMIPNGITRSFKNLISNLSNTQADFSDSICALFNKSDIVAYEDRAYELTEFINKKQASSYQSRIGAADMTIEEFWIRNKYEEALEFYSEKFKNDYLKIFKRETRRLFGDSHFSTVINFDGYSLFWAALLSQVNATSKFIYLHNDMLNEWHSRFRYLKGVFNLYNEYDKLISVSELTMQNNQANLAEAFSIPKEKFTFCNNSILDDEIIALSKQSDNLDKRFSQFHGTKIVTIGRLSQEKDQEKLIRAFKQSKMSKGDTKIFILGSGPLKGYLESLIKELNLLNKVILLGQVDNPYPYLAQADLFVLSSNHEGQPMVLLEALTLGKSIIATDIVGNRSILGSCSKCLVENNQNALSEKLDAFLAKENTFNQLFDYKKYNYNSIGKFKFIISREL